VPFEGEGYVNVYGRDITERKRVENELRQALAQEQAALAENQALLREVHHRVKNNLQMLCDLMYLQMETLEHPEQHQDLQDAYGRVYAIARLHEQLYQSMQSGRVVLGEYLGRLAAGFESLFPTVPVKVEAAPDGVAIDLDRAIHVGLIVNELITNALKHAFPKGQPGVVAVAVRAIGEQVQLQVRDDGRGLPPDLDLEHAKSLGLRIVHILAKRLNASVDIKTGNGTALTVTFPLHADVPLDPKAE
jgi:two-component sensor histidine kinase